MKALLLPAALSVLIFASCAPSTPETRIAAQPAMFESLPAKQQDLVRKGEIAKGMNTDAVYLAWGRASRVFDGSEGGDATLRWDYNASTAFPTNSYGNFGPYGLGYGYGYNWRYGRYPYPYYAGPDVVYVPYRKATVLFRNGHVDSWEKIR